MPRFGFGAPTATEGVMYPIPFADIHEAVSLAQTAERLGFDSVWGNDHLATQQYVRQAFDDPPRFYDPLIYLGCVAASTTTLRLATGILVLPFRHPVLVARQAATLDQVSGGRLVLGVGVGAYREEFEAVFPGRELHRGQYVDEFLDALAVLLSERRASYSGELIRFEDVESYPKPIQAPLPILSGGNSLAARRRAATRASGWLPACLTPTEYANGIADIRRMESESHAVTTRPFEPALQLVVSMHDRHETAVEQFQSSQVYRHLSSLEASTMKGRLAESLETRNLVGTVDEVSEQVQTYMNAGVETFAGLLFATNSLEETIEAMERFSEQVIVPCVRGAQT